VTDPERTTIAVTLLASDPVARRLVVSWPRVDPSLQDRAALVAWARLSGVPFSQVQRTGTVLLRQLVCREDRTVDPEAQRVCQHLAAEQLRVRRRGSA
jgi:hypothetical protein